MSTASKWQRSLTGMTVRGAVAVAVAVASVGCKTGSTWTAKPSWWTFGGSAEDASKLASAPAAPTDVTKPSASAKPYPTTSTPDGYVLANTPPAGPSQTAVTTPPAAEPAAVTYGSRPAPPAATADSQSPAPQVATAGGGLGGLSSITPQVGPYGSAPAAPAAQATATASPSAFGGTPSAFGGAAAADPRLDQAGTRVADARGADSWSAPPAAPPITNESRYGASTGSRFSGSPPAATPTPFGSSAILPAEASLPPASAAPAGLPAGSATPPPAGFAPPPPTRRPDPGYRPGGTSSYRTSRTILAGDSGADTGAVRQASFQSDAGTGP